MCVFFFFSVFFFQAEDGIRDLVRSRGLGDVYKRQAQIRISVDPLFALEAASLGYGDIFDDDFVVTRSQRDCEAFGSGI